MITFSSEKIEHLTFAPLQFRLLSECVLCPLVFSGKVNNMNIAACLSCLRMGPVKDNFLESLKNIWLMKLLIMP